MIFLKNDIKFFLIINHMKNNQKIQEISNHSQLNEESPEQSLAISSDAEFIFGFNISTSQIADIFEMTTRDNQFQLIESEQYTSTAIKQKKNNFIQLLDCFNWWSEGNVTAIKMSVTTRQKDSKRVCRIRGLVGSRKEVVNFIQQFSVKSKKYISLKQVAHEQDDIEIPSQQTNPFYLESCAVYMFHKILSNQKYGIGNIIYSSIKNFNAEFEDAQKSISALPLPMKKAVNITQEVVDNLYKDFNYGRQEMQQIMPYCRISVEKYVFEKIHATLIELYKQKNKQLTSSYVAKKTKILETLTPGKIFKESGLREQLWFEKQQVLSDEKAQLLTSKIANKYSRASRQFERIQLTMSPRQKLKHCQIMYTYLKTIIYEESNGKIQLYNMQDIIPVLILLLLLSQIPNIKTEIEMMIDFVNFDPCDLEAERRLLVNISESFNYIQRDWKV